MQTGEKNAPGLASLEGARAVIGALWKFLNVLLVCFGHFLRLHLELLLGLLGYDDWALSLRSYMMHVRKCLCKSASDEMNTMDMLECKVVNIIPLNASKIHQSFTNSLIMHTPKLH